MDGQKIHLTRRDFLRIAAVACGAGAAMRLGIDQYEPSKKTTGSRFFMGTLVNLTLVGGDRDQARQAMTAGLERMQALEGVFSRFIPGSPLSRLNQDSRLTTPPGVLVDLLRQAQTLSMLAGGAFDVTVKPLVDLYREHFEKKLGLPGEARLQEVLPQVGYHHLHTSRDQVWFDVPGMSVTLDGIAKGYIIDQGVAVLRQYGYADVLVEAGGDLVAAGARAGQAPWRIGLQDPRAEIDRFLTHIEVRNRAIATSGDYLQAYTSDRRSHHILDPRTGRSAPYLCSATVVAPTCAQADALATALMVLEVQDGLSLIRSLAGVDAYLVTKEMKVLTTVTNRKGE